MKARVLFVLAAIVGGPTSGEGTQLSPDVIRSLSSTADCRLAPRDVDPRGAIRIKAEYAYCVRVSLRNDKLIAEQVAKPPDDGIMLVVRFFRDKSTTNHFLYVSNNGPYAIKYQAQIKRQGQIQWQNTSTCPVPSKGAGLEHWPFAIDEVLLVSFQRVASETDARCE